MLQLRWNWKEAAMNINQILAGRATVPVECNGNDLATVCAGLRTRGCFVEALDVVGTSNYRVFYFERVRSLDPQRKSVTEKPSNGRGSGCGATPITLANFGRCAPTDGDSSEVPVCKTSGVTIAAKPTIGKHGQAKPSTTRPAQGAITQVQPVVGGEADFVMRRDRSDATQTSTRHVSEDGKCPTQVSTGNQPGTGLAHPAHNDSIEQRMARLQERLRNSGKLRRIKPEHVRTPHADP